MCDLHYSASVRVVGLLVLLTGLAPGAHADAAPPRPLAPVPRPLPLRSAAEGASVYGLPRAPVHLWQYNPAPDAYRNPQGCGAFSTAMALSVYDPIQYGTYAAAHRLFGQMLQVPIFGGTFESQNAVVARRVGYLALNRDHGTVAD